MNRGRLFFVLLLATITLLGAFYWTKSEGSTLPSVDNGHEGSITMIPDRKSYHPGETLRLTIVNNGSEPLLVGSFYRLYRLEDGKWVEVPLGFSFTGMGYQIGPGQNWSQTIQLMVERNGKLEPLPPGRYRIEKNVIIDRGRCGRGSDEITLSAEFEVVG